MRHLNRCKPLLADKIVPYCKYSRINTRMFSRKVSDKHALLVSKRVVVCPHVPWYTDNEVSMSSKKAKKKSRETGSRTRSDDALNEYKKACNAALYVSNAAHRTFHKDLVTHNKDDLKGLSTVIKSLLNVSNKQPMMPCNTDRYL